MTETNPQARQWGMFCHLAALAGTLIPLGNVIGPLVVWLMKKEEFAFVDDQGKEALNFQLSVTIYLFVAAILVFVIVGIFLLLALAVGALVLMVIAAMKANEGVAYRYPLTIRFLS